MKKRRICPCVLVNGHPLGCIYRNVGYEIDFSALGDILKEMERKLLKEGVSPDGRKTRIFVAPVIRKRRKKRKAAD